MLASHKFKMVFPLLLIVVVAVLTGQALAGRSAASVTPGAVTSQSVPYPASTDTIYLAGGCFWGIQAVFQHVGGVLQATSGYSGGTAVNPSYGAVTTGKTGHAETVRVIYDTSKVSLASIMKVFFEVAHDPTQLNRQGPDVGTQYRSAIFVRDSSQATQARAYLASLNRLRFFRSKAVTEVTPFKAFYQAEDYHQDYVTLNPTAPYVVINDAPKVENLRRRFPELWSADKAGW